MTRITSVPANYTPVEYSAVSLYVPPPMTLSMLLSEMLAVGSISVLQSAPVSSRAPAMAKAATMPDRRSIII